MYSILIKKRFLIFKIYFSHLIAFLIILTIFLIFEIRITYIYQNRIFSVTKSFEMGEQYC